MTPPSDRERAREVWRRSPLTAHDWPEAIDEIAAALDAVREEEAGKFHSFDDAISKAYQTGRAEGERSGREAINALLEACDDFSAHLFNAHNILITEAFAEAIDRVRALERGGREEK